MQKRKKFADEMRLMSCIRHKNIVRCYGGAMARTEHERDCMVMEFVSGGTLDAYIHETRKKDRLRVTEVLSVAIHVADALRYLHPTIVHRDLKPCNVMLDEHGVMKVRAPLRLFVQFVCLCSELGAMKVHAAATRRCAWSRGQCARVASAAA